MKKITSQLLLILPMLFIAGAVFAYTAPTGAPTTNNTDAPIDVSTSTQLKYGGLSVGTFEAGSAGGSSQINQQSFFHGLIRGGAPADITSSINFGGVSNAVGVLINGPLIVGGALQSDTLKTTSGQQQVCADGTGTFFLCGAPSATPPSNGANDKYIYSSSAGSSYQVDNLGNGDCTPGYTVFSLDTGRTLVDSIGTFSPTRLIVQDSWPSILSPQYQDPSNVFFLDASIRNDASISSWNNALVMNAPTAGTYDIKYTTSGHLNMTVDNGKQTSDGATENVVSFYMSVKRAATGNQENFPMVPVTDICQGTPRSTAYNGSVLVASGPSDAGNTSYRCDSTNLRGDVYHAESDYAINFAKTVSLQPGDKVYLFGMSVGQASKGQGHFGNVPTMFGSDQCKPFLFKVTNGLSIFDVTLHP